MMAVNTGMMKEIRFTPKFSPQNQDGSNHFPGDQSVSQAADTKITCVK